MITASHRNKPGIPAQRLLCPTPTGKLSCVAVRTAYPALLAHLVYPRNLRTWHKYLVGLPYPLPSPIPHRPLTALRNAVVSRPPFSSQHQRIALPPHFPPERISFPCNTAIPPPPLHVLHRHRNDHVRLDSTRRSLRFRTTCQIAFTFTRVSGDQHSLPAGPGTPAVLTVVNHNHHLTVIRPFIPPPPSPPSSYAGIEEIEALTHGCICNPAQHLQRNAYPRDHRMTCFFSHCHVFLPPIALVNPVPPCQYPAMRAAMPACSPATHPSLQASLVCPRHAASAPASAMPTPTSGYPYARSLIFPSAGSACLSITYSISTLVPHRPPQSLRPRSRLRLGLPSPSSTPPAPPKLLSKKPPALPLHLTSERTSAAQPPPFFQFPSAANAMTILSLPSHLHPTTMSTLSLHLRFSCSPHRCCFFRESTDTGFNLGDLISLTRFY
ncbi:hypothetical protein DFH09DRAFT_1373111 [Mycena vulgaris]|nr:hypothetical protein DFH09DRAFT_1373111 [Mycena vulgaris]